MVQMGSVDGEGGRLAAKVAVVTGGASGIGLASVLRFCREGPGWWRWT